MIECAAGDTAGPPSAVKRPPLGTFQMTFELTAADSMIGPPLPPKMSIEARTETDGNTMTEYPTDLSG